MVGKVFMRVINARLADHCESEDLLVDEQAGFRPRRSCADQLFILTEVLAERRNAKKKVAACFIDVRKAYDRVWRDGLWKALWQKGVRGRMWRVLRDYYKKVQSSVRLEGGNTEWFDVSVGVRQGCVISPILFDVFVDGLAREVKALGLGVAVGGDRLSLLLYADDIVVLADSENDLQRMMVAVEGFCRRWRLQVNMGKTKVVHFGARGVGRLNVQWQGKVLEEVEEYKYLGMLLQKRGTWKKTKEKMLRQAKRAAAMAWNMAVRGGDMTVKGMTSMWTALIRPHLEYGAEVLDSHNAHVWEEAEKLARKIGRRVLKCGRRLPNDAIQGDLGWMSMRGRRMLLRLSYWGKILSMEPGRWVRKIYEQGRARLEANAQAGTWCSLTRKWLTYLGLDEEWQRQEVGPVWQEKLRTKIEDMEARDWRRRVARSSKLEEYTKWKTKPGLEPYLQHGHVQQRRLWTKLRGGCLELRIETGRWERVTVWGRQVALPRHMRRCKLCFGELEDAHHVLFRCPAYERARKAMAVKVSAIAPAGVVAAMTRVRQGRSSVDEAAVMKWMMAEGGEEIGMEMVEAVMKERGRLLSR